MIVILAALEEEVGDYLKIAEFRLADNVDSIRFYESNMFSYVAVVIGGPGRSCAQSTTTAAIDRYHPQLIVSAGFGGGTVPDLKPGHLVVADTVLALTGPEAKWSRDSTTLAKKSSSRKRWLNLLTRSMNSPHVLGSIVTVDSLVTSAKKKAWLGKTLSDVMIVDLETYWVTQIAAERATECVSLRSMLDPVGQNLPAFVTQATENACKRSWWHAAAYSLKCPSDVPTLLALSSQYKSAKHSLSKALHSFSSSSGLKHHEMRSGQIDG